MTRRKRGNGEVAKGRLRMYWEVWYWEERQENKRYERKTNDLGDDLRGTREKEE